MFLDFTSIYFLPPEVICIFIESFLIGNFLPFISVTSSGTLYILEALTTMKCNLAHLDLTGTFGDDEVRHAFEKVKEIRRNFLLTGLTGQYRVLGVGTQDALQFYLERNTLVTAET